MLCSLSYVIIDDAIAILSILQSGRSIILAKIDIKSAATSTLSRSTSSRSEMEE